MYARQRERTGVQQGAPLSALLTTEAARALNQTKCNENIYYLRDVLAKDGCRIPSWYVLQQENRIHTLTEGPREQYAALRE